MAFFDDLTNELLFSTAVFTGDGRQASHWKDNNLSGALIGVMDPTLGAQQVFPITSADIRAFDVIGWDFEFSQQAPVPEPGTLELLSVALLSLVAVRWRRTV